jgi:hypothetical protein
VSDAAARALDAVYRERPGLRRSWGVPLLSGRGPEELRPAYKIAPDPTIATHPTIALGVDVEQFAAE